MTTAGGSVLPKRLLWFDYYRPLLFLVAAQLLDMSTTIVALSSGQVVEANPLGQAAIASMGLWGVVFVKFVSITSIALVCCCLGRRFPVVWKGVWLIVFLYVPVLANNALVLLTVVR